MKCAEVITQMLDRTAVDGTPTGSARTRVSEFRFFLKITNRSEDCAATFLIDKKACLRELEDALCRTATPRGRWKRVRCALLAARSMYLQICGIALPAPKAPPRQCSFWERYKYLFDIAYENHWLPVYIYGNSKGKQWRGYVRFLIDVMGFPSSQVDILSKGHDLTIDAVWRSKVEALEDVLQGSRGDLTSTIFEEERPENVADLPACDIRRQEAGRFHYRIPHNKWPPHFKEQFEVFCREEGKHWKRRGDYCGTRSRYLKELEFIVGFAHKETLEGSVWRSGLGLDIAKEPSLFGLASNPTVILPYVELRKAHQSRECEYVPNTGRIDNGIRAVLSFAMRLLRLPDNDARFHGGFVARHWMEIEPSVRHLIPATRYDEELMKDIPLTEEHQRRKKYCEDARGTYEDILRTAGCLYKPAKNETILRQLSRVFELDDPDVVIAELQNSAEQQEKRARFSRRQRPRRWANAARERAYVEIMAAAPFRIIMFGIMSGTNLRRTIDDQGQVCYAVEFPAASFKNTGHVEVPYTAYLNPELTPFFDEYFQTAWPILNAPVSKITELGRKHALFRNLDENGLPIPFEKDPVLATLPKFKPSELVFRMVRTKRGCGCSATATMKNIMDSLSNFTRRITRRVLGRKYGFSCFSPHAFRHIAATAAIKQTHDYKLAAHILWDSEETVEGTYSHVLKSVLVAEDVKRRAERMLANRKRVKVA